MQFILLIYGNENEMLKLSDKDATRLMDDYRVFTEEIIRSGHMKGGERIRPTSYAVTVRDRSGSLSKKPGPFAVTTEQLGGYYVIEAKDEVEAAAIASRVPGAKTGSIEVRPIWPTANQQ